MSKLAGVFGILALTFYSIAILDHFKISWSSDSMPRGIYREVNRLPAKGEIAASCLTYEVAQHGLERGYFLKGNCDTGIQPVIKPIQAMEGDVVSIEEGEISINGQIVHGYQVHSIDSQGRPLKKFYHGEQKLKKGEFWLMSNFKDNSYDSRYFGAVSVEYIVEPVITTTTYKTIP